MSIGWAISVSCAAMRPERRCRVSACRKAVEEGRDDLDFFRPDGRAFETCQADSIDYAVMEHTPDGAVVPVDMGWNDVAPMPHARGHDVLVGGEAYFLHSYHFKARYREDVLAMSDHGGGLVAAVGRDNVVGVQFHPEKSQAYGLDLLSKFLEWKP